MMIVLMTMISEPPGEMWTSVLLALKHNHFLNCLKTYSGDEVKSFLCLSIKYP